MKLKKINYIELVIILAGLLLLATAVINTTKPLNSSFLAGCDELRKNYSCDPDETSAIVVPDYRLEDGSYAHLVDVCQRLGTAGQSECARLCGC